MKLYSHKWFTFVELMVVIVILSILWVVWFISFSSYLSSTRDANRISQVEVLYKWLMMYSVTDELPEPDNKIDIISWSNYISYQWSAGKDVIEEISYTSKAIDPYTKDYFSYYLTRNKKYAQLLTVLENNNSDYISGYFWETFANEDDNKIFVKWSKLWILTNDEDVPLEQIDSIKTAWNFNTSSIYSSNFKSYLTNEEFIKWDAPALAKLEKIALKWWKKCKVSSNNFYCLRESTIESCLDILNKWKSVWDGVYEVIIDKVWGKGKIYCDMTTDGWGWTMLANAKGETTSVYSYDDILHWTPVNSDNCSLWNECLSISGVQLLNWQSLLIYSRWYKIKWENCNDKNLSIQEYTKLLPLAKPTQSNWLDVNVWAQWKCDTLSEVSQNKIVSKNSWEPFAGWDIWMWVNFRWNDSSIEKSVLQYGPTLMPSGLGTTRWWTNRKIANHYNSDEYTQINSWDGASTQEQVWFIR